METKIPYTIQSDTRKKINELRNEVDKQWAYDRRKEYLIDVMRPIVERCLFLMVKFEVVVLENNLTAMELFRLRLHEEIAKLIKSINELYYTKPTAREPEITPTMIARAKEYPFENLIELKRGMALCPFHDDKDPSFSVKNNHGKCFSGACGWSGDVIAFYMEKKGVGFCEAVRRLSVY